MSDKSELFSKLRSLIIARLLIGTTLLVGAAIPLEISGIYSESRFLFPYITLVLILTIIHSVLLNKINKLNLLVYLQILGDIFLETVVVIATGGIESPFSILYVLTILVAGYLIPQNGAFHAAIIASVVFGSVIFYQYQAVKFKFPQGSNWFLLPPPSFAVYTIFVNLAGFFISAVLSSRLSARIQRIDVMLKEKTVQYTNLRAMNDRIIQEIPSGLITVSQNGAVVSVNPAAIRMLDIKQHEAKIVRLDSIFPGYLAQSIVQIASGKEIKSRCIQFQKRIKDEDRWFKLEIIRLKKQANVPIKLIVLCRDVTAQKKLEETRRKAERWSAIAEISAGIAHEIRNPLASISGSVEVLMESLKLGTSERKLMNIVVSESDRLNRLITDFLDLARPRRPEFSRVDIHKLISESMMLLTKSPNWNNEIIIDKRFSDSELRIAIDENQITQVIWNIAKNAVDAMPDGGIFTIDTQHIDSIDEDEFVGDVQGEKPSIPYVKIIFSDTGTGMSDDIIEKIFDPFVTYKRKGVGIGLAIVFRIIESHRGCVEVISSLDEGSTFIIRLPCDLDAVPESSGDNKVAEMFIAGNSDIATDGEVKS